METLFWACLIIIVYHFFVYPLVIVSWMLVSRARNRNSTRADLPVSELPSFSILVPAYNEARYIEAKIANLARLDYPSEKVRVVVALDGCTDDTAAHARRAIAASAAPERFDLREFAVNRGKIAVLNEQIALVSSELLGLTDASAIMPEDSLRRIAQHFQDQTVGVVCPTYIMAGGVEGGEDSYWSYQNVIKEAEGLIAAPIGPHGPFYAIRRKLWKPLDRAIINDDFVLPMRIVANGARAIYDPDVKIAELEPSTHFHDFRRRVRLGAGNLQQVFAVPELANPARGALAFLFVSSKVLRALVPPLAVVAALASLAAALQGSDLFRWIVLAECALLAVVPLVGLIGAQRAPRLLTAVAYALRGIAASAWGAAMYLAGSGGSVWRLSNVAKHHNSNK